MLSAQYMCCSPSMEVQIEETGNRLVPYADIICKGLRAYTQIRPDITWDYQDIMMVSPKQSLIRVF